MFQQSTLMVDSLDAIAVSRNNISLLPGASNSRATFLYAWNEVNRGDNVEDPDATLLGFLTETDFALSTVNFDMVWVDSDVTGDGFYTGLSATQRLGRFNTAFRVVHSKTGNDLGGASARAFTGLQTWVHVLESAGSTKPADIQQAANKRHIEGSELVVPWAGIKFSSEGDEIGQNVLGSGLIGQYQKGADGKISLEIVYPFDVASADMIYPFPQY